MINSFVTHETTELQRMRSYDVNGEMEIVLHAYLMFVYPQSLDSSEIHEFKLIPHNNHWETWSRNRMLIAGVRCQSI